MRSTKSIRRDIQINISVSAIALGCAIFFAIACFVYLTFNNAMTALLCLLIASFFIGKAANYIYEHREVLAAQYPEPTIDLQDR